jgi:hypothetical protein
MHEYQSSGGVAIADIPDHDVPPEQSFYVHSFGPDPNSWAEALRSPYADEWIKASLEEKNSFRQHHVYDLVPRSEAKGKKIYKPRPVFKIKIKPPAPGETSATLDKFKFRQTIAAFANTMKKGVDFEEKRASTVRWESTLTLIALAVDHDLDIAAIDIKTFFLYGNLPDDVYMEQPPEWEEAAFPAADYVCKLQKSMYGLPQAPHCAQGTLSETLLRGKYNQSIADDCVYSRGTPRSADYAATGSHVDDLLSIGTTSGLGHLRSTLEDKFELVVDMNPSDITGVQIVRDRPNKWLKLHQAAYIEEMLVEFNMTECNTVDTPMDPGTARVLMELPLADDSSRDEKVLKRYRQLVGSLIWLYRTRIDMLYAINLAARFLHAPTQKHLDLVLGRTLRYLKGTKFWGIVFVGGGCTLSAQSDAAFADDLRSCRSTRGHFLKLGECGIVSANCTLERKICTSTQHSETYALGGACRDIEYVRLLLSNLGESQQSPTSLDTDNQGAYNQSSKQVNHATAKHFRVTQAYIRNLGDDKTVRVGKVSSADNHADIFTKALPFAAFARHRAALMGPQGPPSRST